MKTGKTFFTFLFIICIFVLFEIFIADGVSAQNNNAKAYFKKESVKVGEAITLYLDFNHPAGIEPSKNFVIDGIEDFDVLNKKITPSGIELKLLTDRPDSLDIPALKVVFKDKKGKEQWLESKRTTIKVVSTINEKPSSNLLRPVKGIVSTNFLNKKLWFIIIPLLSTALIVFGTFFYIRRKKNKAKSFVPDVPFHINALNEIDKLSTYALSDKESIKKFYFRLSEILRAYIKNIRGFNALEMTTDEILKAVTETRDLNLIKTLKKIDLVKFADFTVSKSGIEEDVSRSKEYINNTKPADVTDDSAKPEIIDTDYTGYSR